MGRECACCGCDLEYPNGYRAKVEGDPTVKPFLACDTCLIYEDFVAVDPEVQARLEQTRKRMGLVSAPATPTGNADA